MSIEVDNRGNLFFSDRAYIQLRIPDDSEGSVTYSPEIGSRLLDLFKMHPLCAPFYWRETPRISQYYVFARCQGSILIVHSLAANILPFCKVELLRLCNGKYRICFTLPYPPKRRCTILVDLTRIHPWCSELGDCIVVSASSVSLWKYRLRKFLAIIFRNW